MAGEASSYVQSFGLKVLAVVRNYEPLELPDMVTGEKLGAAVREHLAISKAA